MSRKEDYIAVFDSGIGGISVLRELLKLMPQENYLYYGDCAHAPYGTRSTQEVRELTLAAGELLISRGIKALVVACNTATAAAISDLRQKYPDTIIVGIEPALKLAADHFPTARVGVLATPVTLREEKFSHLQERFPKMSVTSIPLPGLVARIEAGATPDQLEDFLRPILAPYAGQLDAVVLGCTHYPLIQPVFQTLFGPGTTLLDGGKGTAMQTQRRLREAGLLWDGPGKLQLESSNGDSATLRRFQRLIEEAYEV